MKKIEEIIQKFKEKYSFQETSNNYSVSFSNENVTLNIKFTELTYLIEINALLTVENDKGQFIPKNEIIQFDGAISDITLYYFEVLFECLEETPYPFKSCIFQKEYVEKDLSKLIERLIMSKLEYNFFLKYMLNLEKWDGSETKVYSRYSDIKASIENKNEIPFLNIDFEKSQKLVSFSRSYTIFEFLLDFMNDYSWVDADKVSYSSNSLENLSKEHLRYFTELLKFFNVEVTVETILGKRYQIPIQNKSLFYIDFYMNDFGVILRLFTKVRPYKPFLVKLPLRNNISFNFTVLKSFLYMISQDTNGNYISNCFDFFKEEDSFYMNIFVGLEFEKYEKSLKTRR